MKKLWGKLYKNNRLIKDETVDLQGVIDDDGFFEDLLGAAADSLHEICSIMDIENPIWFDSNSEEFMRRRKTRFLSGNFVDTPDFDRLDIEVIEAP